MVTILHVDGIFACRRENRCDRLCEDLNRLVPINNLGELRWYAGGRFVVYLDADILTIPQQAFDETTAAKSCVCFRRRIPLTVKPVRNSWEFGTNEPGGEWPSRELVRCLVWLASQIQPDVLITE